MFALLLVIFLASNIVIVSFLCMSLWRLWFETFIMVMIWFTIILCIFCNLTVTHFFSIHFFEEKWVGIFDLLLEQKRVLCYSPERWHFLDILRVTISICLFNVSNFQRALYLWTGCSFGSKIYKYWFPFKFWENCEWLPAYDA